ncbi:VCBS repeat-containing protein [Streptomyces sp. ASQP_92]|uniref:FG-GAP repeat domain-containing protein n=1 Tax=Streptomyces sp. ASQP_92 TaxID=2979116 RepID=UPI0021BFE20C|nr:VCBS repeat-containing protein [Streptomyces sp. ASQP_92]MCT9094353.1 VCBS repeat-containing protein [Streptomyces sp. ASQP_92]
MRVRRFMVGAAVAAFGLGALAAPAEADDQAKPLALVKPALPHWTAPSLRLPPVAARSSLAAGVRATGKVVPRFDADKDGVSDLLMRGLDDQLHLARWKTGEAELYVPGYTLPDPAGTWKDVIEPGDLDGDGGPELLVLGPDGSLKLVPSNGYGKPVWSEMGWQIYNKVFMPGDVTGDGKNDLMARTPNGELYLFAGTGNLAVPFVTRIQVGWSWNIFDQVVGAGDMNGDGFGDVVARTPAGDLFFYAGTGTASAPLKSMVKISGGWGDYNQILTLDNNTGHVDLIARDVTGTLWMYPGDDKGGLGPRVQLGTGWRGATLANSGGNPFFGKNELIGWDTTNTLNYYLAQGDGSLADRLLIDGDMSSYALNKLSSASSMNNTSRWSTLTLVRADGHLEISGKDVGAGWNVMTAFAGIGDLNNDGKGDLLARDSSGHLYFYPGNGADGIGSRTDIGAGWNAFDILVGAGDVTGDGLPDLLAREPATGHLWLYPGAARAGFGARIDIGGGWNIYNKIAVPGDMNGDGLADLVGTDVAGISWRYDADGTGNFHTKVKFGSGWNMHKAIY